jgi:hypothetical protein
MLILSNISSNIIILFILIQLGCLSCKQASNTKVEDFVKAWQSVENPLFFKATLSIKEDGTFRYSQNTELCKGFSNGNWIFENYYLVLTSERPDSCFYITEYGDEWTIVSDSVLVEGMNTTIKGCIPDNCVEFIKFEKDSFYIKNDSLFHSSEPNEIFPFSTKVFW